MKRPSVTVRCVADRHHTGCERIVEFSAPNGKGGLIAIRQFEDGRVVVEPYRLDAGVFVSEARNNLRADCARRAELIARYAPGGTLIDAEKAASGYAMTQDESQPVDEETLSSDIDEMRAILGVN